MKKNKAAFLEEEKVTKLLITQSLPMIIARFTDIIYNVVDTLFVSYIGLAAIAGVAITLPLTNTIGAITAMFGPPAASYIARTLGANNKSVADKTASMSTMFVAITSTLATIIAYLFLEPLLAMYGASDEILKYAKIYASVLIISVPFSSFIKMFSNIVRSEGNSKLVMTTSIMGSLLNIILDAIFIFVFNWGIIGVAFATVIAKGLETLLYGLYFLSGKSYVKVRLKYFKIYPDILKELLKLGIPNTISDILKNVVAGIFIGLASQYGIVATAAMGIVNQINKIYDSFVIGFNQGLRIIVGYNYGAKRYKRVKEAIIQSIKWRLIVASCIGIAFIFVGKSIIEIYLSGNERAVYLATVGVIITYLISPIKVAFSAVAIHYNISIGKPITSTIITFLQEIIFLLPAFHLMTYLFGEVGVFLTKPLVFLLAGIVGILIVLNNIKHLNKKIIEAEEEYQLVSILS